MRNRTNIVQVSGGKDSTAVLLYAISKSISFTAVFCDTGWEDPQTYAYLDYLESALKIQILRLYPKLGFVDLAVKKKRFPSTKARFCTTELKVVPFVNWLLDNLTGDIWIYQGIRADESNARAAMSSTDDYFKMRKGDYAIRRIRGWLKDGNSAIVHRPIFAMTAEQVFDLHKQHGIDPNPLYKQGFTRVGCMPCIMCRHSEIKNIADNRPDILDKLKDAEAKVGRTFFGPDYIAGKHIATVDDVVAYLELKAPKNQTALFEYPAGSCKSIYNICE
jgi:3'-phosphoadenosine 5'-phosphosulfate sulfotransferase (PAPS reductase)/FAD synthetase